MDNLRVEVVTFDNSSAAQGSRLSGWSAEVHVASPWPSITSLDGPEEESRSFEEDDRGFRGDLTAFE